MAHRAQRLQRRRPQRRVLARRRRACWSCGKWTGRPSPATHVVNGAMPDYWHVLDIADFTGDGRSDVLWQDDAGVMVLWEMDGADDPSQHRRSPARRFRPTGTSRGRATSTATATADILWRDDAGVIVLWEMDGPDVIGNTAVGNLGADWHVEEIADFNGDAQQRHPVAQRRRARCGCGRWTARPSSATPTSARSRPTGRSSTAATTTATATPTCCGRTRRARW